MRLHFTIGCYDRRWTFRRHQILQFSRIQVIFADHVALATPSLPEKEPQIGELWNYADEDHLGKCIRAKDVGLECEHDVPQL